MNITLILFLVIVAISAFKGYRSGILVVASRIVSLALAYLVSILFADSAGTWLQEISPIEGLMSYAVGGSLLFILTSIVLSSIFSFAIKLITAKPKEVNKFSFIAGGFFGGIIGCVVGVLVVWLVSTFQGVLQAKKGEKVVKLTAFEETAHKITGAAITGIVETVSNDSELAKGATKLLINPAENIQHLNNLTKTGQLRNLFQDYSVVTALESRNIAALLETQAFNQLIDNPDFIALAEKMNLADDKLERDKQIALKVTTVWVQVKQVQNNPEYIEIMQDPIIRQNLQSGNTFNLLNNAKVERLMQIISSSEVDDIASQDFLEQEISKQTEEVKEKKIYRWVDEKGRVHYSDKEKGY